MYKTLISCLFSFIFLAAMCGCEDENSPTEPGLPEELYPINSSSSWVYDVEARRNDTLRYRNTDKIEYDESIVWGGSWWYGMAGEDSVFWQNGVEGVWRLRIDSSYPYGLAEKYYAYPVEAGMAWFVSSDADTLRVVSTSESVEVPAGKFENCFYYSIVRTDRSRQLSVWIKPGTGIVQFSSLEIVGEDTLTIVSVLK